MRRILLGLALFSVLASVAYAAGGECERPLYVRPWQGDTRDFWEVTCTTTGDVALVTAAEAANAMPIYFYNTRVELRDALPTSGSPAQCNDATDGFTLKSGTGFTSNVSVAGRGRRVTRLGCGRGLHRARLRHVAEPDAHPADVIGGACQGWYAFFWG